MTGSEMGTFMMIFLALIGGVIGGLIAVIGIFLIVLSIFFPTIFMPGMYVTVGGIILLGFGWIMFGYIERMDWKQYERHRQERENLMRNI